MAPQTDSHLRKLARQSRLRDRTDYGPIAHHPGIYAHHQGRIALAFRRVDGQRVIDSVRQRAQTLQQAADDIATRQAAAAFVASYQYQYPYMTSGLAA